MQLVPYVISPTDRIRWTDKIEPFRFCRLANRWTTDDKAIVGHDRMKGRRTAHTGPTDWTIFQPTNRWQIGWSVALVESIFYCRLSDRWPPMATDSHPMSRRSSTIIGWNAHTGPTAHNRPTDGQPTANRSVGRLSGFPPEATSE